MLNVQRGWITLGSYGFRKEEDVVGFSKRNEDSFVFMQYTGLKDKTGKEIKEIYEGDVIRSPHGVVEFGNDILDPSGKSGDQASFYINGLSFKAMFPNDPEVIGNIYETPELVK